MKELCRAYDEQSADIIRRWESLAPERWNGALQFFGSERPASSMAWSFLFDIVHHRGQITDVPAPDGIDRATGIRSERGRTLTRHD